METKPARTLSGSEAIHLEDPVLELARATDAEWMRVHYGVLAHTDYADDPDGVGVDVYPEEIDRYNAQARLDNEAYRARQLTQREYEDDDYLSIPF